MVQLPSVFSQSGELCGTCYVRVATNLRPRALSYLKLQHCHAMQAFASSLVLQILVFVALLRCVALVQVS